MTCRTPAASAALQFFLDQIRALRAQGGDVIISFGGCNGEELASVITDVDELVAAYQLVVDTYDARCGC